MALSAYEDERLSCTGIPAVDVKRRLARWLDMETGAWALDETRREAAVAEAVERQRACIHALRDIHGDRWG